jgi:hypothetical protein
MFLCSVFYKTTLYHLPQQKIFLSTVGERAEADTLSGGDYDGDLVWVCWDEDIVKYIKQMDPTQYPTLPKEKKKN